MNHQRYSTNYHELDPVMRLVAREFSHVMFLSNDELWDQLNDQRNRTGAHSLTLCVLLMELFFREVGPNPEVPALAWALVFGDIVEPPDVFMSPSQFFNKHFWH